MPHESTTIETSALGDLARISPALQLTKSRVEGGEHSVRAITMSHVLPGLEIDWETPKWVEPKGDLDRLQKYAIQEGDLLLTLRLPIQAAIVGRIPKRLASKRPVIAVGPLAIVRVDSTERDPIIHDRLDRAPEPPPCDPEYLAWCLGRRELFHEAERQSGGTLVQLLSIAAIKKLEIPAPPMRVQRRITTALAAQRRLESVLNRYADASRRRTDALIANLLQPAGDARGNRTSQ